ncbi:hypothetical protein NONI108955_12560 [Nocardia ninae]|uniref:DUF4351 domain-containing protein n=2 Tax=Nocardia ninae TaxID=356145 RepID=A0A511MK10_9NOCA|nr:hypothetical protein NN4_54830 [Nocardia ninae NBRC 108245]
MPSSVHEAMHCLPARNEYIDVIMAALPAGAARHFLEMLMMTKSGPYVSAHFNELYAEGKSEGVAQGKAQSLLILAVKHFPTGPQIEAKVNSCTDPAQLDQWTRRAITADSIEEVFAD